MSPYQFDDIETAVQQVKWNKDWFAIFGLIIHNFARLEWLIQMSIACFMRTDLGQTLMLTVGLSYQGKRDALYSLLVTVEIPAEHKRAVRLFLDEADKYTGLRNSIAHSTWRSGTRPNSIKPMELKVRGGKGKPIGVLRTEPDYLHSDLVKISDKLALIYSGYLAFLKQEGYLSNIERNIKQIKSERSSSVGLRDK